MSGMNKYRVSLHNGPTLTVDANDCDLDTDRAAFYKDDELVAYIPGGNIEYIERIAAGD